MAIIHGEKAHKKPHLDIGDNHREFGGMSLAIDN